MAVKPVYTTDQVVNKLVFDEKGISETWSAGGVTYSIGTGAPTNFDKPLAVATGYVGMTDTQIAAARLSFQLWSDLVKDINLTQLTGAGSTGANITFSYTNSGKATFSQSAVTDINTKLQTLSGDQVWINSNWQSNNDNGVALGGYGLTTMIHEIGHSLGLNHPGNYNASDDGPQPNYDSNAEFAQDSVQYTVMSYFWGYNPVNGWVVNGVSTDIYPQTPMLYDIAAIQAKYGANLATRSGDTVYGFNCSLASNDAEKAIYDFSQNKNPIFTIWDGGGNNTLDCSGFAGGQTIKLNPGEYSSVNGLQSNVAIAFGCKIQNGIGGSANDTLVGENVTNTCTLKGAQGDDAIQGLAGSVTFSVYSGVYSSYSITQQAALQSVVQDNVAGRDGTDSLTYVQRLKFTDITLALDTAAGQDGGEAYRLYQAAFDRTPDKPGLGYWINSLDQGAQLTGVASAFIGTPEFIAMYGADSSNSTFVNLLYQHVLHRAPDTAGSAYWLGELGSGHMGRGAVLASFSEAPENIQQTAPLIANGVQYQQWLG